MLYCCMDGTQIAREKLVALGTCVGKLTHSGKFRLTIGALDILAQHAKYKVSPRVSYLHSMRGRQPGMQFSDASLSGRVCTLRSLNRELPAVLLAGQTTP